MSETTPSKQSVATPVRRRLNADARRAEMLQAAAAHFAAHGFESSTRDLADEMGVTQALIYKHFKSKDDLIEQTLEATLGASAGQGPWLDAEAPLAEALAAYYKALVSNATEMRMRLFMRAGLDG